MTKFTYTKDGKTISLIADTTDRDSLLSLFVDGQNTPSSYKVKEFVSGLDKVFLPVDRQKQRFNSKDAVKKMLYDLSPSAPLPLKMTRNLFDNWEAPLIFVSRSKL